MELDRRSKSAAGSPTCSAGCPSPVGEGSGRRPAVRRWSSPLPFFCRGGASVRSAGAGTTGAGGSSGTQAGGTGARAQSLAAAPSPSVVFAGSGLAGGDLAAGTPAGLAPAVSPNVGRPGTGAGSPLVALFASLSTRSGAGVTEDAAEAVRSGLSSASGAGAGGVPDGPGRRSLAGVTGGLADARSPATGFSAAVTGVPSRGLVAAGAALSAPMSGVGGAGVPVGAGEEACCFSVGAGAGLVGAAAAAGFSETARRSSSAAGSAA